MTKLSKEVYSTQFEHLKIKLNMRSSKLCLFLHFGLGDLLCMVPAIHYLSTIYSEVKIACLKKNMSTATLLFKNNKKVTFLIHDKLNSKVSTNNGQIPAIYSDIYPVDETKYTEQLMDYTILRCGLHKYLYESTHNLPLTSEYTHREIPFDYYKQINIFYLYNIQVQTNC